MKTTYYVIENPDDSKTIIEGSTIDLNNRDISDDDICSKIKDMRRQSFIAELNKHNIFTTIKLELK